MSLSDSEEMNKKNMKEAIFQSTFPYCGLQFLDCLSKELVIQAEAHTCVLLQLLTPEEYKQLSTIYSQVQGKYNVISRNNSEPTVNDIGDHFLLIRSIYSTKLQENSNMRPNGIIPLCSLDMSSPYVKTLLNEKMVTRINDRMDDDIIYPGFEQFIGIRLENEKSEQKSLLCVMSDNDTTEVENILYTIEKRCVNEMNQLRKEEQLMIARDIAVLDAENKLKFLADMSHEIRTPMNAVIALTDLLLQERINLNYEQVEHLELIQTSGNHILTIVNDILDISKLNHDPKFKLESRRFSVRKCLKDTLSMARHQASMNQQNKFVHVLECPPDKDDNIPLPQLIQQLESNGTIKPLTNKKGKTVLPIIWRVDPDVPDYFLGDTMRLTQIILNLLSNAVKFTKEGGIYVRVKRSLPTSRTPLSSQQQQQQQQQNSVGEQKCMTFKERYDAKIETIWTRAMQEKKDGGNTNKSPNGSNHPDEDVDYFNERTVLEASVTDTGIGIPADRLPKLFKSFSQIDISTARRYGGTGLGLAISSTLVNRMGGCVWVESEEGVGSRFALTLPMTVAHRGRHYSSDSNATPHYFINSPSSPSSTISDSSNSVHSALGNDVVSPLPSSSSYNYNTTSSPNSNNNTITTINNNTIATIASTTTPPPITTTNNTTITTTTQSTINNVTTSNFFPNHETLATTTSPLSHLPHSQQQQQQQRPTLPRTTIPNQLFNSDLFRQQQDESPYSPMAEDTQPLDTNLERNTTNRKMFNDLLAPATKNSRVVISKQHYNRKPQGNKEENLAKSHPLRILLAEDNILNQKIAISILKRLGYIDVAIANNGKEVLNLMKTSVFDVIFMDLYMPEMDGLEVTREIIKERTGQQEQPNNNEYKLLNCIDVYIIALTASASREDRQICIDAGMNDFISKPFTMVEMKSALKTCANNRKKRRKLRQQKDDPMVDIE
ncbi:hypothetical protein G6F43_002084 [Rhizopus delemar]|nr:hypothetical protein G6F43_002084 [Rhizopus delemar]